MDEAEYLRHHLLPLYSPVVLASAIMSLTFVESISGYSPTVSLRCAGTLQWTHVCWWAPVMKLCSFLSVFYAATKGSAFNTRPLPASTWRPPSCTTSTRLFSTVQAHAWNSCSSLLLRACLDTLCQTLCQEEEFEKICSRESLTEKAADIEISISVKEHRRERNDFDPIMLYENRFWNRRPDGIVINKNHQTLYILEFDSHLTEMRIF